MTDTTLVTIRCLQDNYAYLVHRGGITILIDAPEAAPIQDELSRRGWRLDHILLTHHHADHIQAVDDLRGNAQVWGHAADAHRLPPLDHAVTPGTITVGPHRVQVIDVSGHTVGHVAFHFPDAGLAFTADSLMAMGCGRLFEGDADMMWASLSRLNALPDSTLICSGHDYCAGNGAFALSVDPDNQALKDRIRATAAGDHPCSPASLASERATNPFLRVTELRGPLGLTDATDAQVFARLRQMKDSF